MMLMNPNSTKGEQSAGEPNIPLPNTVVRPDGAATEDNMPKQEQESAAPAAPPSELPSPPKTAPQPELLPAQESTSPPSLAEAATDTVAWTASEFIARQKSVTWYVLLAAGAALFAAGAWFFTRDVVPPAAVLAGAVLFGFYAGHKPRQLAYTISEQGLTIGNRLLPFSDFRSFAVVPDGAFSSIELSPLKRFAMPTTIYFDPANEAAIISILGAHLPTEEPKRDSIDQLMRHIRF